MRMRGDPFFCTTPLPRHLHAKVTENGSSSYAGAAGYAEGDTIQRPAPPLASPPGAPMCRAECGRGSCSSAGLTGCLFGNRACSRDASKAKERTWPPE